MFFFQFYKSILVVYTNTVLRVTKIYCYLFYLFFGDNAMIYNGNQIKLVNEYHFS